MDYTELIKQLYDSQEAGLLCIDAADALEALQSRVTELGKSYTEELDNISTRNYELRKEKDAALAQPEPAKSSEVSVEEYLAILIDRGPEPLQRLGSWLGEHLDEDDWKTAERMLFGVEEAFLKLSQPEPTAQILADRLVNAVIAFATPESGDVSDIGLQPEPVGLTDVEHFSVVMGCARTYAYEYSQKDDRLINAAYKRLEFNLRAAIAAAKGGAL